MDLCRDATSGLVSYENVQRITFGTEPSRVCARVENLASVLAYDESCVFSNEPSQVGVINHPLTVEEGFIISDAGMENFGRTVAVASWGRSLQRIRHMQ